MIGLTPKQAHARDFIVSWLVKHNGVFPSYRQMQRGLGFKSVSNVQRLIDVLVERGHLVRLPCRDKRLQLVESSTPTDGGENHGHEAADDGERT